MDVVAEAIGSAVGGGIAGGGGDGVVVDGLWSLHNH